MLLPVELPNKSGGINQTYVTSVTPVTGYPRIFKMKKNAPNSNGKHSVQHGLAHKSEPRTASGHCEDVSEADRESVESRQRGIGVILSAHREEIFRVENEDKILTLQLKKARRRFNSDQPSTRYQFCILKEEPIPVDDDQNRANKKSVGGEL